MEKKKSRGKKKYRRGVCDLTTTRNCNAKMNTKFSGEGHTVELAEQHTNGRKRKKKGRGKSFVGEM